MTTQLDSNFIDVIGSGRGVEASERIDAETPSLGSHRCFRQYLHGLASGDLYPIFEELGKDQARIDSAPLLQELERALAEHIHETEFSERAHAAASFLSVCSLGANTYEVMSERFIGIILLRLRWLRTQSLLAWEAAADISGNYDAILIALAAECAHVNPEPVFSFLAAGFGHWSKAIWTRDFKNTLAVTDWMDVMCSSYSTTARMSEPDLETMRNFFSGNLWAAITSPEKTEHVQGRFLNRFPEAAWLIP